MFFQYYLTHSLATFIVRRLLIDPTTDAVLDFFWSPTPYADGLWAGIQRFVCGHIPVLNIRQANNNAFAFFDGASWADLAVASFSHTLLFVAMNTAWECFLPSPTVSWMWNGHSAHSLMSIASAASSNGTSAVSSDLTELTAQFHSNGMPLPSPGTRVSALFSASTLSRSNFFSLMEYSGYSQTYSPGGSISWHGASTSGLLTWITGLRYTPQALLAAQAARVFAYGEFLVTFNAVSTEVAAATPETTQEVLEAPASSGMSYGLIIGLTVVGLLVIGAILYAVHQSL